MRGPATLFALAILILAGQAGAQDKNAAVRNCDLCLAGVAENGTLLRSRGVKSASRIALGRYQVVFSKTFEGCAILATAIGMDVYVSALLPPKGAPNANNKTVEYWTTGRSGGSVVVAKDTPFTTALVCSEL